MRSLLAPTALCSLLILGQPAEAFGWCPERHNGFTVAPFADPFETPFAERRVVLNGAVNGLRAIDTFCRDYRRVVLTRDDLARIRLLSRTARNRIQANDLYYLCRCEGFRSPMCGSILR